MAVAAAVVAFWAVAMTALVMGGARDRRRRKLRDEVARQAAFRRILFTQLPPDCPLAVGGADADGLWRAWDGPDDGPQVRIVPPDELPAGPPDVVVRLPEPRLPEPRLQFPLPPV